MPIIENSAQGVEFFYSKMAKNDVLEQIENEEIDEDITPVLKWNRGSSSWLLRFYSSGNLQTTLKGEGFTFLSFIEEATNKKETIVVWSSPVNFKDFLRAQESAGKFYLANLQKTINVSYFTSSLSVFISSSLSLPKEIQNLAILYTKEEALFKSGNLLGKIKFVIGKTINPLIDVIDPSFKTSVYQTINKIKNPKEFLKNNGLEEFTSFLDNRINLDIAKKSKADNLVINFFERKLTLNFKNLLKLGVNITELITAPEVFLEEKIRKKLTKKATEQAIRFEKKANLFKNAKYLDGKSIIELTNSFSLDVKSNSSKLKSGSINRSKSLIKEKNKIQ